MSNYKSPAAQLRHLLSQDSVVTAVGVYDGISARVAINSGAQALYQTGAGTSASALGRADLGFLSMSDMVREAGLSAQIASSKNVPVIADADVGFGGAPQVSRTIQEYHRAGIAALHIEDQVASKRCGHLDSKQLVSTEAFVQRIKAAAYAISKLPCPPEDRIMLIARTDALATEGFDAAIARLEAARENGADIGFLEGITKDDEATAVTSHFSKKGWPILANAITGGKTPLWRKKDVQRLGFKLAIYPTAGIFPALYALRASYKNLLENGIGIEAETGEKSKVDLGGADPKGLRNFFVEMGLEEEVEIDQIAANGQGLGAP